MTQAYNLSQLANRTNSSGQISLATDIANAVPIGNGGSNNASLLTTAGGIVYTDGSKLVNTGAGTSGQFLRSNGASAPSWFDVPSSTITTIATGSITSGVNSFSISGLNLTNYTVLYFSALGFNCSVNSFLLRFGSATSVTTFNNASNHLLVIRVDLIYGVIAGGFSKITGGSFNSAFVNDSGYRSSSTSVALSFNTGNFNAGATYRLYGQT